ncbi:MAG: superoxide dismutase [Sphingomonadaceae bacterium]|uniref:superoxide dismutase n=1 Tax=Thermaurantiacus sp. TaxID=2820283 RepID=UPI00298F1268|nr:superoxide dismutase [Thermaurantiacus sp.]MCS6986963.1 superoxide dismutase [Sphingomonadaceae bacterium]MDW8415437.1 superoxide dismutase [Thermaurantiacus sp.]
MARAHRAEPLTCRVLGLLTVVAVGLAPPVAAQGAAPQAPAPPAPAVGSPAGPFRLPDLPYPETALAPVIDAETMRLHHGAHHRAYVNNLNAAVAGQPALAGQPLEALLARVSGLPKAVRDNGGGHWNHDFFWRIMAPPGTGGEPSPALRAAIERDFGSLDAFRRAFEAAGLRQFGSGWVWLILRPDGQLAVTSTPNQDNPLMDVVPEAERGTPILGNDVWEHAYYLTYRNRRGEYLQKWWDVVNWREASRRFAAAQAARR